MSFMLHARYSYKVNQSACIIILRTNHNHQEFKTKVHLLPGNHDINHLATLKQFKVSYNVSDHTAFSRNGYRFYHLGLGDLNEQLDRVTEWAWFEHELKSAAKRGEEIIFAHHHLPFEFTEDEPEAYWTFPNRIRGKYLDLVKNYGVHHILVGHRHETKNIYASDNSFTIYVVAGTARFFDGSGFGNNYFDVSSCDSTTDVNQEYVHLVGAGLMKRSEGLPNGCPDIFAH
ncbi:Ser/Thr protein phosphatase [Lipomyces starkeyi]